MPIIPPVAAEDFIAAVTGQRNRHPLAGQRTDEIGRQGRTVGKGFVVKSGEAIEQIEIIGCRRPGEMIGFEPLGHHFGVARFVIGRVVERNRAGVDRRIR